MNETEEKRGKPLACVSLNKKQLNGDSFPNRNVQPA